MPACLSVCLSFSCAGSNPGPVLICVRQVFHLAILNIFETTSHYIPRLRAPCLLSAETSLYTSIPAAFTGQSLPVSLLNYYHSPPGDLSPIQTVFPPIIQQLSCRSSLTVQQKTQKDFLLATVRWVISHNPPLARSFIVGHKGIYVSKGLVKTTFRHIFVYL